MSDKGISRLTKRTAELGIMALMSHGPAARALTLPRQRHVHPPCHAEVEAYDSVLEMLAGCTDALA